MRASEAVYLLYSEMIAVLGNLSSTLVQQHYLLGEIEQKLNNVQTQDFLVRSSLNNFKSLLINRIARLDLQLKDCISKFKKETRVTNGSRSFPSPFPKIRIRSAPPPPPLYVPVSVSAQQSIPITNFQQSAVASQLYSRQDLAKLQLENDLQALTKFYYDYFKALYAYHGVQVIP